MSDTTPMRHDTDAAPLVALPEALDDAAAAALLAFFLEAARVLEAHYAGQLIRHAQGRDERQCSLWDDDPPF
jgi:NADPH:quinone reductase-like Zn-dependent oxidoreductase